MGHSWCFSVKTRSNNNNISTGCIHDVNEAYYTLTVLYSKIYEMSAWPIILVCGND